MDGKLYVVSLLDGKEISSYEVGDAVSSAGPCGWPPFRWMRGRQGLRILNRQLSIPPVIK